MRGLVYQPCGHSAANLGCVVVGRVAAGEGGWGENELYMSQTKMIHTRTDSCPLYITLAPTSATTDDIIQLGTRKQLPPSKHGRP